MADKTLHRVVIVGGGFGGLHAAFQLRSAPARVTLVDSRNFHLFQPLLYQVATGALSPANIAAPLRALVRRQKNTEVVMARAVGVDAVNNQLMLEDGEIPYDTLIVATGSRYNYFGKDEWSAIAPALKTVEDATQIRRKILSAFESAEREKNPDRVKTLLTFVIVGAGPTGVEMAGALSEVAHRTLRDDFRSIDPTMTRIYLLDTAERVLPAYPPDLSASGEKALRHLGVITRLKTKVTNISAEGVSINSGGNDEFIAAHTVLWAAGIISSPLAKAVADATGAKTDKLGRIIVEPDLTIAGHPEVVVIGDTAQFTPPGGKPLPGVAPVAMQQGRYAAELIRARLKGRNLQPFKYHDKGNMATIGRAAAVADLGWIKFSGFLAWLAWLFVHLMYLVQFDNKLLVLFQWAWNYFTFNRSARLITGPVDVKPASELPEPHLVPTGKDQRGML